MLKHDIAHIITASLVREGDATGHNSIELSFFRVTDAAEAAAEDILNLIEDTQSRYYEERWEGE
jgi:hypothetical protein